MERMTAVAEASRRHLYDPMRCRVRPHRRRTSPLATLRQAHANREPSRILDLDQGRRRDQGAASIIGFASRREMPNPDIQRVVAETAAPAPLPQGKSVPKGQQQLRLAPTPSAKEPDARLPAAPKPVRKRKFPGWLLVLACIAVLGGVGGWY